MKPKQPNVQPAAGEGHVPSLAELRAYRHAQKETNRRVEELRLRLFRMTEQHMDQAIRIIKRWMDAADSDNAKKR
ncbi:MAG TPA: flagellar M-ring protein FliF [Candidatus Desulfovibrio gallistercoris]|uniref:flagellar M-ring protein FliF n=1 Tax=uncultured Desulfovibrio sp. TaxID=167968 RepID=UPI001F9CCFDC|nr:flagellar M-ring protein FliF [uncultured Desulfovibrio sp.]HJA76012.1 flagellar M-ring protein FliF [Candidatus Desulfovibrio gallistercoris]